MRVLVADAHPPHAAANADAVEALLALSGADVRRVAAPAQPAATRTRKRRPRRRCIHPGGWAVAELQPLLSPDAAARGAWAGAPLVVVGDGPVNAPASPGAAASGTRSLLTDGRAILWVNTPPGDTVGSLQALLSVGAVRAEDRGAIAASADAGGGGARSAELEVADPSAYAVLPRAGRRVPAELRDVLRALAAVMRDWRVRVVEVADAAPHLHAYAIVELLDLPVALCHSTLRCFLAAADGRRVAVPLLREGLTHAKRQRQELARLPVHDPQALVAAARGLRRATDDADIHAPDRAYGRVLQAWQRGDDPHPVTANEVLLSLASRMGTNPVANARVVQLAGRARTSGYFGSPAELLAALA